MNTIIRVSGAVVAQLTLNQLVVGSNPTSPKTNRKEGLHPLFCIIRTQDRGIIYNRIASDAWSHLTQKTF